MHVSCLCKFRTSGYGDPDGIHSSFRKIEYSICAFFVQLILFSAQTASELGEEIVFYECQTISEWKLLMSSEFHHRSKIIVINFFYISIEKMNIHLFSHSDFRKYSIDFIRCTRIFEACFGRFFWSLWVEKYTGCVVWDRKKYVRMLYSVWGAYYCEF